MATMWYGWNTLLTPSATWAYLLTGDEQDAEAFLGYEAPTYMGVVTRMLRGARCDTKSGLLQEWAAALQFPSYFGGNWDAFEECINDFWWTPARGYVLTVTHADRMLHNAEDFATFVQILGDTATQWAKPHDERGRPKSALPIHTLPVSFRVVLHCEEPFEAALRNRFRRANVRLGRLEHVN